MKYPNGYMPSLKEETLYKDTWDKLQRETHFSDREMFRSFPDLYNAMEEEELRNITIRTSKFRRKFKAERRKQLTT